MPPAWEHEPAEPGLSRDPASQNTPSDRRRDYQLHVEQIGKWRLCPHHVISQPPSQNSLFAMIAGTGSMFARSTFPPPGLSWWSCSTFEPSLSALWKGFHMVSVLNCTASLWEFGVGVLGSIAQAEQALIPTWGLLPRPGSRPRPVALLWLSLRAACAPCLLVSIAQPHNVILSIQQPQERGKESPDTWELCLQWTRGHWVSALNQKPETRGWNSSLLHTSCLTPKGRLLNHLNCSWV